MVNGMYSVSFSSATGAAGNGVAAVRDGTINGGDAGYGYIGTFRMDGSKVAASLRVLQHAKVGISIFGPMTDFRLEVSGTVAEGDRFSFSGGIPGHPNQTITIRGRKFADLAEK